MLDFTSRLDLILEAAFDGEFRAAVGIVQCGDKFLLGLAKNCGDDREGKWVFPGGGIKRGEDVKKAAVREVWEETGVKCKAIADPIRTLGKKDVAFVHCKASRGQKLNNNHEFTALGWFTKREMRSLRLYHNVTKLIERVT